MGAFGPWSGSGVKAVATIWLVLVGFTARFGSLSWFASPDSDDGMRLTTRCSIAPCLPHTKVTKLIRPLHVIGVQQRVGGHFGGTTGGGVQQPQPGGPGSRLGNTGPVDVMGVREDEPDRVAGRPLLGVIHGDGGDPPVRIMFSERRAGDLLEADDPPDHDGVGIRGVGSEPLLLQLVR